jgi:hypothetical protein
MKFVGVFYPVVFGILISFSTSALSGDPEWAEKTGAIGAVSTLPTGLLNRQQLDDLVDVGEKLFVAKFTTNDGAGRPAATQAIDPTKTRHRPANGRGWWFCHECFCV